MEILKVAYTPNPLIPMFPASLGSLELNAVPPLGHLM
jgi:hypothetical protein